MSGSTTVRLGPLAIASALPFGLQDAAVASWPLGRAGPGDRVAEREQRGGHLLEAGGPEGGRGAGVAGAGSGFGRGLGRGRGLGLGEPAEGRE